MKTGVDLICVSSSRTKTSSDTLIKNILNGDTWTHLINSTRFLSMTHLPNFIPSGYSFEITGTQLTYSGGNQQIRTSLFNGM